MDLTPERRQMNYATHTPRISDSSLYDEVCTTCGAKDLVPGENELETRPCRPPPIPAVRRYTITTPALTGRVVLASDYDALRDRLQNSHALLLELSTHAKLDLNEANLDLSCRILQEIG
jgi:hypothetical protein